MELQLYEKNERCKLSNKGKKSGSKNSKSNHDSLTLVEIMNEALDLGKRLCICVIGYETSAIRRITRSETVD